MPELDPLNISGQLVAEKYRVGALVGEGGFALVYRAEHTIWKQPVAVKFFSGLSQAPAEHREELLHQFLREGALLTELSSQTAGIVQARDVGAYTTPDGHWMPYMVLEWLEGSPLDAILAQDQRQAQAWTEDEVVGFLGRILPILDVAHRRGISHRDIKPANIFIMGEPARSPETPCKLLDFGVAKMVSDQAEFNAALAKTGVAITSFTPRYGAPEQFTRSYGATGPWTDVYAIALMASEMLAGRAALEGGDFVQYGFASSNPAQRPSPRTLGVQVSDQVESAFQKALAVLPEDRFQNAGEFLAGLRPPVGNFTPMRLDEALPSRSPPAPSSTIQLAPTVLVSPTTQPVPPAPTTKPEREPPPAKLNKFGAVLFILIVLGGGTALYCATEFRGASETRTFILSMVRAVRETAARWLPILHEKAQQALDKVPDILPSVGGQTGTSPKCPPGTRVVTVPPAGSGSTQSVCVDEQLVSEIDYAACLECERPKLRSPKGKAKTKAQSDFCRTGKSPTTDPISCVPWKQAQAYCHTRAGRLPGDDELRAANPSKDYAAALEWTQATPEAARERLGPFRCVRNR
ncbi:MAG TPA: serine/threonine-protein kinase [Polyangia bacterium]